MTLGSEVELCRVVLDKVVDVKNSKYFVKCNKGVVKVCGVCGAQEYLCKYLKLVKVKSEIDACMEMEVM